MGQPATVVVDGRHFRRAIHRHLEAIVALQRASYARNRNLLGIEPLPLLADYGEVFAEHEIWCHEDPRLVAALILELRPEDMLVWSVATAPEAQSKGLGNAMLRLAEKRARHHGRSQVRLYTGSIMYHLISWYGRHGYEREAIETLSDRRILHMVKVLRPKAPVAR